MAVFLIPPGRKRELIYNDARIFWHKYGLNDLDVIKMIRNNPNQKQSRMKLFKYLMKDRQISDLLCNPEYDLKEYEDE